MAQRFAFWSIPIALIVLSLKLFAWQLTGSVAMLSDAIETVVNVVAALLAFIAVRLANKPADQRHPFGHRKAEYLSAVAEGALIVLAALLILHEAIGALTAPKIDDAPTLGIAINGLATAINGVWAYLLLRAAHAHHSPALAASSKHVFTDVWTSFGVIGGLILAHVTGWLILDPLLAILVALNILWEGWKVIRTSVDGLMDVSLMPQELAEISTIVETHMHGALEFHDLKGRRSGKAMFVEFHLVVEGTMQVDHAHDICDRIELALLTKHPDSTFLIHLEPNSELLGTTQQPAS